MPVDGWHEYELWVLDIMRKLGYKAELSSKLCGEQDGGIDIDAIDLDGRRVVVQCKYYDNLVGSQAVQRIAGWLSDPTVYQAAIVTTVGYTDQARVWASNKPNLFLLTTAELMTCQPLIRAGGGDGSTNPTKIPDKYFRQTHPPWYADQKPGFLTGCMLGSIVFILYSLGPYLIIAGGIWFLWFAFFGM